MNGIIIKITDKNIVIGFENGTAKEFPIENLNFEPYINAQVLILMTLLRWLRILKEENHIQELDLTILY